MAAVNGIWPELLAHITSQPSKHEPKKKKKEKKIRHEYIENTGFSRLAMALGSGRHVRVLAMHDAAGVCMRALCCVQSTDLSCVGSGCRRPLRIRN